MKRIVPHHLKMPVPEILVTIKETKIGRSAVIEKRLYQFRSNLVEVWKLMTQISVPNSMYKKITVE